MNQPPAPSGGRWRFIIMLLMAVGFPSAAGYAFAAQIVQNPWAAVGLAVLYETVLFVGGSIAKIWQRLEPRWLDQAADWVDIALRSLFSSYRKKYLQYLIYQHRAVDVKGLTMQGPFTLDLERVYVELSIDPQPPLKISSDLLRRVPESLREGSHPIWSYLQAKQMNTQNLVVIGTPGSGKTTLLKHMVLILATSARVRAQANAPAKLPIFLFLRNHVDTIIANPDTSLAGVIHDSIKKYAGPPSPSDWLEKQLAKGRCLVLLDGLDEVADPQTRKHVVAWVERQMLAHSNNRFIVTSRPFGYLRACANTIFY